MKEYCQARFTHAWAACFNLISAQMYSVDVCCLPGCIVSFVCEYKEPKGHFGEVSLV